MATNEQVLTRIRQLYEMIFRHDGFGEMRIEMRILKKRQKEVIIHCGKQYRYVVDFDPQEGSGTGEDASRPSGHRQQPASVSTNRDSASERDHIEDRKGGASP
jgi:hypothetical protein